MAALVAIAAVLGGLSGPRGDVVRAAAPTWGAITADATFGVGIVVHQVANLPATVRRVELLIEVEGGGFVIVQPVGPEGRTADGLTATYETPFGALVPNTPIVARFRVTDGDGAISEGPEVRLRYEDDRLDWRTLEGDLVRIHWTAGGSEFGRRALAIADRAVGEATTLLGVTETEPIDFFVYANQDQFRDVIGPGARENVGGQAHPDIRTLFARIAADAVDDPWVAVVIPHELMHVVFDSAVENPYHHPPRWLNEGVAVYLAEGYGAGDRSAVRQAIEVGALMPLSALTGQFPTAPVRFSLAYSESVSAVDHLVRAAGTAGLAALVRSYADGVTDDEAFEAALGMDVAAFEADWLAGLGTEAPIAYGPQPAPPGPKPSDWNGPAATPGSIDGPSAAPTEAPGTADPNPTPTATPGPTEPDAGASGAPLVIAGLAATLVLVTIVAIRRRRRGPGGEA